MQDDPYQYIGAELELFSAAKNWKKYIAQLITPYIHGDVLEPGAGIGANTRLFFNKNVSSWVLLEPDKNFCGILLKLLSSHKLPLICSVINGTTNDIKTTERFDTIIYIDVLEHIEDDKSEIVTATNLLKQNGKLILLSPAHNFLMSPFDKAIGHYRRYSKKMLLSIKDERLKTVKIMHVDSLGFFASLANKYFLKQQYPGKKQIAFWDNWMIPASKIIDRILFYGSGKTIIAVWKKI